MKSILLNLLLIFTLVAAPTANAAQAAGPITFGKTTFDNKFRNSLTFKTHVSSTAGQIVKARLFYKLRNEASYTQVELQFDPASEVDLSYTWKTDKSSIPPSAPILHQWEATDSTGHTVKSDEQTFRYDDVNYHWKKRENGDLSVWWHDRPDGFGQRVFDIATQAFTKLRGVFNAELDYPIRIIIYNDFAEFKQWNKFFSFRRPRLACR